MRVEKKRQETTWVTVCYKPGPVDDAPKQKHVTIRTSGLIYTYFQAG